MVDLPEFSIEGGQKPSVGGQKKKEKKGLKGRGSMKVVKPGPWLGLLPLDFPLSPHLVALSRKNVVFDTKI